MVPRSVGVGGLVPAGPAVTIALTPEQLQELLEAAAEKGAERALARAKLGTPADAQRPRGQRTKRAPTADDHEIVARMNVRKGIHRPA